VSLLPPVTNPAKPRPVAISPNASVTGLQRWPYPWCLFATDIALVAWPGVSYPLVRVAAYG